MSSFTMNAILEKTESRDKDFRYMATSDLLAELSKESFKPDSDSERKMCRCLLKLINDQSSDVQSLAVKCLSPLVRKVHEERVDEIMMALCGHVLSGTEEQRDICSIGLKTVVLEMPASMAGSAIQQLAPQLITGVQRDSLEVKLECLSILSDLLRRFASHLAEEESRSCLTALFAELNSSRAAARKRAIACIASLSASLPDRMLDGQLVGAIVTQMNEPGMKLELRRTYIQTLSAISRSGGYRLAKQVDKVIPLILLQINVGTKKEEDAELLESCLQAFESFVMRCPKEAGAYQEQVGKAALHYLSYDPNYADDDDDMEEDEMEQDEEDEEDEEEDYSDDDDVSWKVRRAAAKVLSSLLLSRPDRLHELLPMLLPTLISRFREREENVKMDVFSTFNDLLSQVAAARAVEVEGGSVGGGGGGGGEAMVVDDGPDQGGAPSSGTAALLAAEVPKIVKAAAKQLTAKSSKTRIASFHCLRQLVQTLPGCLSSLAASLVPGVEKALKESGTGANPMRIEALLFLRAALPSHPPKTFQPFLAKLLPPIIALADDRYYKTVAEALRVLSAVVHLLRPDPPNPSGFDYAPHVAPLYGVVERRLQALDQDQEVKECAISCMGLVVHHLADHPAVNLGATLPTLLERMRNEITRVTAVKTFALLGSSPLDVKLGTVLQSVVVELTSFLRKSNRPLRQASLTALEVLISGHAASLSDADVGGLVTEAAALVSESDLHVSHLALVVAKAIAASKPSQIGALTTAVLPRAMALLQSSVLQGVALRSLLAFLADGLVAQNHPQCSFDALLQMLLTLPSKPAAAAASSSGASLAMSRHALSALSQAVAACCHRAPPAQAKATVDHFVTQLGSAAGASVLSLLCLGEIGKLVDLSSASGTLLPAILSGFDNGDEEVRSAASLALGSITAGAPEALLPTLLGHLDSASSSGSGADYLLLHALKEMLGAGHPPTLAKLAPTLMPKLLAFAERDEEGVRNVVAECLGRLAAVAPDAVVPKLIDLLPSPNAPTRATVIGCVRFTVTELGGAPLPSALASSLLPFLKLMEDADLKVRRGALLALNCLAFNKPAALRELLPTLLPLLYGETAKRPELVHQVDLGPFKHTVDDGLEIRKAAFEAMETLLSRCPDRLEFGSFLAPLVEGLSDDGDIKLLTHRMLIDLTALPAAAPVVVSTLEAMCDPLAKTLKVVLKDNAVKQQIERHHELIRSAMRAVRALEKLAESDTILKFTELLKNTLRGPKLADKYAAICAEEESKGADE